MNAELAIQLFGESLIGAQFFLKNYWHKNPLVVTIDRLHPDPEQPEIIAEAIACTKGREVIEVDANDDLTRCIWVAWAKEFRT